MSPRLVTLAFASILALTTANTTWALADKAGATACAAKLPQDARAIYDASAPSAVGASDLKQVVTDQTRALAMSGKIARMSARSSAEAAGACLQILRS